MGCDIHGFLEIRQKSWICLKEIPKIRCYDIFGILAGVRNYINAKPISAPKGIPEDASEEALEKINMWVFYGHSYSFAGYFRNYPAYQCLGGLNVSDNLYFIYN